MVALKQHETLVVAAAAATLMIVVGAALLGLPQGSLFNHIAAKSLWLRGGRSLQQNDVDFPPALASIASQIKNRDQLDILFLSSEISNNTTLSRAFDAIASADDCATDKECSTFTLSGRGINFFPPFFSSAKGWLGTTIMGTKQQQTNTTSTTTSLELMNDYDDGIQRSPADLYVDTLENALPAPYSRIAVTGWPSLIKLDDKPCLIVDYRTRNSIAAPAVDGMRPVTRAGLEQAGITVTEDVADVWVGYLVYTSFGAFNMFCHYFIVQFDAENMKLS